jgi:hypothetical protein
MAKELPSLDLGKEEVKIETRKEVRPTFTVGNVVSATEPAILIGEQPINMLEAMALILNKLEKIEKAIA